MAENKAGTSNRGPMGGRAPMGGGRRFYVILEIINLRFLR